MHLSTMPLHLFDKAHCSLNYKPYRLMIVLTGTLEVSMISGRPAPRSVPAPSATALTARGDSAEKRIDGSRCFAFEGLQCKLESRRVRTEAVKAGKVPCNRHRCIRTRVF